MISTRAMGRDGATLRVQGWDGSALVAGPLGGAEPLGFAAGDANLYRYVGNDPIDDVDPTGFQQAALLPNRQAVTDISTEVINYLKQQMNNGGLPTGFISLPGVPGQYQGPCALYAQAMTEYLDCAGIEYTLSIYDIDGDKFYTVNYYPPEGGSRPVEISARQHIVVVVKTQSGTVRFDSGVGLDPVRPNNCSNGNFGDTKTGVIDPKNSNPTVTGPPGGGKTKVGQPILKPQKPVAR